MLNKKITGNKILPILFCIGTGMGYTFGKSNDTGIGNNFKGNFFQYFLAILFLVHTTR